jgi:hypothetical protein
MEGEILKYNCNVENQIEEITQNVACELSWEWWLARNVK